MTSSNPFYLIIEQPTVICLGWLETNDYIDVNIFKNPIIRLLPLHLHTSSLQSSLATFPLFRLGVLSRRIVQKPKPPKPNGGWGDIRDHELCFSYVNDKNQA